MHQRIKPDHTAPEHEEAIRYVDDLILRMKLQLLGEEHVPVTMEELDLWLKHRNNLERCRRRLIFY